MAGSLTPEGELLLLGARTGLDEPGLNRASFLAEGGVNWEAFALLARRHGVVPLVHRNLARLGHPGIPASLLGKFREHALQNALLSARVAAELRRILASFASRGAVPMVLKGPVLDQVLYGAKALREYSDIDLFVLPEDVPLSRDCLVELGYRPGVDVPDGAASRFLRHAREWQFFRPDGPPVELHWEFGGSWFPMPVELREAWPRAPLITFEGLSCRTLSPEDTLLFLCFHGGAMHYWQVLRWICDVAGLIDTGTVRRWDWLWERAASRGCGRMVLLGLRLAAELLGAAVPESLLARARASRAVLRLARWVTARTQLPACGWPTLPESCLFRYLVFDRLRDRLRNFLGATFAPTKEDWKQRE